MPEVKIYWDLRGLNPERPLEIEGGMIVNNIPVVPGGGKAYGVFENQQAFMLDVVRHLKKIGGIA